MYLNRFVDINRGWVDQPIDEHEPGYWLWYNQRNDPTNKAKEEEMQALSAARKRELQRGEEEEEEKEEEIKEEINATESGGGRRRGRGSNNKPQPKNTGTVAQKRNRKQPSPSPPVPSPPETTATLKAPDGQSGITMDMLRKMMEEQQNAFLARAEETNKQYECKRTAERAEADAREKRLTKLVELQCKKIEELQKGMAHGKEATASASPPTAQLPSAKGASVPSSIIDPPVRQQAVVEMSEPCNDSEMSEPCNSTRHKRKRSISHQYERNSNECIGLLALRELEADQLRERNDRLLHERARLQMQKGYHCNM